MGATLKALRECGARFAGALSLVVAAVCAQAAEHFPERLDSAAQPPAQQRGWSTSDIVEVTRIVATAIDDAGKRVAFLLKSPSLSLGENRYALYLVDARGSEAPHKLIEAAYLADLEHRPGTQRWTFRADLGDGVQLYEMGTEGKPNALLVNPQLAAVGGADGLVPSSTEGRRATGILDYSWAPDGSVLWYTKLKLRSSSERQALFDHGLVYDATLAPFNFYGEPPALAVELWTFDPATHAERLVDSMPGDARNAPFAFSSESVRWVGTKELVIRGRELDDAGRPFTSVRRHDLTTGETKPLSTLVAQRAFAGAAVANAYLTLQRNGERSRRLVLVPDETGVAVDLGEVLYTGIDEALATSSNTKDFAIFSVRTADRIGLMIHPRPPGGAPIEKIAESLTNCSFDATHTIGACSRESVSRAPELVTVAPLSGRVRVIARPNVRYDAIAPLRTEPASWTSKFGYARNGYITYPRGYRPGRRYPTIVITHASDARNLFAYDGFQWAFPLQVFAERGYLVLSVNEHPADEDVSNAYATSRSALSVERMQRGQGLEAVASMEAAVQSLIDRGICDPQRVGIAGYSRGGIVTTLTLSQSAMFKAGINADTGFFNAGGFWRGDSVRALYRTLFGGSPYDPRYIDHYRAFSPSARAEKFSGPLLQFFTGAAAHGGMELHQALKEAGIPAELIIYPDETHVLHRPRAIASTMQRSLDWFDRWLRSDAATDPGERR